jgi:peptide/nickel transport system permease protein
MIQYAARRLVVVALILAAAATLMFTITHLAPGSPIHLLAGENPNPETVKKLAQKWGLEDPIYVQLGRYLRNVLVLDMGRSMVTRRKVGEDIALYLPATVELTLLSVIIAGVVGLGIGVFSVIYKGRLVDQCVRVVSLLGVSTPVFWFGLLLLIVFYLRLDILPGGGRLDFSLQAPKHITGMYLLDSLLTGNWNTLYSAVIHIILPSICLSFSSAGRIARIARAAMLSVYNKEYVRAGRAKGLAEGVVLLKYVLKNALIPILTMIGEVFGVLMGGAVLTETIFSWPGLGRYAVQAALALDYPAITGYAIVTTFMFAITNLLVDLSYGIVNPKITYD